MQSTQDTTTGKLQGSQQQFSNNYNQGAGANLSTYNDVMGKYGDLYNNPFGTDANGQANGAGGGYNSSTQGIYSDMANNGGGYGWDSMFRGAMGNAISGYGDFANNGGFSDQAIQDLRARGVAPTRAVFANAQDELNRSRNLSGGGSNYAASKAKMARDLAYGISDTNTNVNAGIAQMQQQGRLAGLSGLSSTGAAGQGLSTNIDQLNAQMKLAGLSGLDSIDARSSAASSQNTQDMFRAKMGVLGGMQDMYGTNPALLNTTGNQLLQADQNLLANQQNQNQIGLGMIGGTQDLNKIPGNFGQVMNNVGQVANIGGRIVGGVIGAGGFDGLGDSILGKNKGTGTVQPNPENWG